MAEKNVDVEGINYYTLYELPDSQDESAPCVLLVHALMSNLNMYDATAKALHAAGYSTLRYDHVGHHNTPPPQHKTTERRMSLGGQLAYHMDDLTRHMHQLVKERTGKTEIRAVLGCSIGGVLALRYAMMFPKEVDQIISIAGPGGGVVAPEAAKKLWSQRIQLFEEDQKNGEDKLCQATVNRWFPGGPEDDGVRVESLQHVKTCSIQGYKLLADTIRNFDYANDLGKIKNVKCLIGGGTEDGAISLSALEDTASKIDGAQYVELKGAGHLPPMQQPEEFNKLMLSFLGSS